MYDILELKKKKLQELQEIAKKLEIDNISNIKKIDLIYQILDKQATSPNDKSRSSVKKQEEVNKDKKKSPKMTKVKKNETVELTFSFSVFL